MTGSHIAELPDATPAMDVSSLIKLSFPLLSSLFLSPSSSLPLSCVYLVRVRACVNRSEKISFDPSLSRSLSLSLSISLSLRTHTHAHLFSTGCEVTSKLFALLISLLLGLCEVCLCVCVCLRNNKSEGERARKREQERE